MNIAPLLPYMAVAVAIGCCLAMQAPINARLGVASTAGPLAAALVNFGVGTLVLLILNLANGGLRTVVENAGSTRWWMWTAGLLGVCFVSGSAFAVRPLGVAVMLSLVIAGQLAAGITLDALGAFGHEVRAISPLRVVGVVMVLGGAVLIQRS